MFQGLICYVIWLGLGLGSRLKHLGPCAYRARDAMDHVTQRVPFVTYRAWCVLSLRPSGNVTHRTVSVDQKGSGYIYRPSPQEVLITMN